MFSRCQLTSHLSRATSTSHLISRPCQVIARSSREPGPSSLRQFSKDASAWQEKHSSNVSSQIEWPTESWDDIFSDLDNEPFKPRRTLAKKSSNPQQPVPKAAKLHPFFPRPVQRQTLTKSERDTLSDMVDMILKPDSQGKAPEDNDSAKIAETSQVNSLIDRLRQYSRKQRKPKLADEVLDKKLEEISLCSTDLELLEWAAREVFGESTRLAKQATNAMAEASRTGQAPQIPILQSPLYPHLIAHLMRTFRIQYQDPHLALSIFDHAKSLSTLSFVFGCSTGAYNELLATQWLVSHNLEVIHTSIEEMVVNGVPPDSKTRKFVEALRQELTRTSNNDIHVHDMHFLTKIDQLIGNNKRLKANRYEEWKSGKLAVEEMEGFDDWKPSPRQQRSSDSRGTTNDYGYQTGFRSSRSVI